MFNRFKKKIEELEETIKQHVSDYDHLSNKCIDLEKENKTLREKLIAIQESMLNTPKDCKIGSYCRVCEFSKIYAIPYGYGHERITVCDKQDICPSLTLKVYVKEETENDKT